MFAIASFGIITIALGVFMAAKPAAWGQAILVFANTSRFHVVEIAVRVLMGLVLVIYADRTTQPSLFLSLGYLMFGVAAFLLALGESRHRRFAVRSATYIRAFRPGGLLAIGFGIFTLTSTIGA